MFGKKRKKGGTAVKKTGGAVKKSVSKSAARKKSSGSKGSQKKSSGKRITSKKKNTPAKTSTSRTTARKPKASAKKKTASPSKKSAAVKKKKEGSKKQRGTALKKTVPKTAVKSTVAAKTSSAKTKAKKKATSVKVRGARKGSKKATHKPPVKPPFAAYKGIRSYLFSSYAHKNMKTVFKVLKKLDKDRYRIWYDEGIEPGFEWPEVVGSAVIKCTQFLVFMSPAAADSRNVRNEVNLAFHENKDIIVVFLKKTNLTSGMRLQIGTVQYINHYELTEREFYDKLMKVLNNSQKN
jgi:hypothetical protein